MTETRAHVAHHHGEVGTRIRVFITGALNRYSRVIEVEAWGTDAAAPDGIEPEAATSSAADRPRGLRR